MRWSSLRGLSSPIVFWPEPKQLCGGLASQQKDREFLGFLVPYAEQRKTLAGQ